MKISLKAIPDFLRLKIVVCLLFNAMKKMEKKKKKAEIMNFSLCELTG